jgi:hypothetical protein
VLACVLAPAATAGARALISAALGGALEAVNLLALARSARALLGRAEAGAQPGVALVVALRVLLLFSAVGVAILLLPMDPLWFVLGLSSAVPAAIWHGLATAGVPARAARNGG